MTVSARIKNTHLYRVAQVVGLWCLRALAGNGFASDKFSVRLQFKHFFVQKILGFNRHVPWPVHCTSKILCVGKIQRGTRCPGLAYGCHIDGRNGIEIGDNVWIGPRVSLISMNHDLHDFNKYVACKPIVIGANSWIATGAIILSGVVLGGHTVVAAGSVVTKSFPDGNQVLAGNPARVVRALGGYCDGGLDAAS